jgi:argininosuccinate lyase
MKLWNKGGKINTLIENFTIGNDRELDLYIAEFDVLGSLAHIIMLENIRLLNKEELLKLKNELKKIYKQIKEKKFHIDGGVEDVHSQIEIMLTKKLGDLGKKIHTGRSRNDQVLADIKMYIRSKIKTIVEKTESLFDILINQSERYKNALLPGYTHLQVAMPSSFGLWFGAYAEALTDDLQLFLAAYKITNQNPLGSGAGYGSSFPLNRQLTTDLLGFDLMSYNTVYAQMGRGKTEKITAAAVAAIAATLSKLATDVCLYMSQNFEFFTLPDEFSTGSSIMPHKKNPDVFELLRAKCNKLQTLYNEISYITNNLPSGYFRDFQIIKESLFPAFECLENCLSIAAYVIDKLEIRKNILDDEKYKYIFSVEEVNKEVIKGVPFRDAYTKVSKSIQEDRFVPDKNINHTHEGSIGNLCNQKIKEKMQKILHDYKFEKVENALTKLLKA